MPVVRSKYWYPGLQASIREMVASTQPWCDVFAGWGYDRDWHAVAYAKWLRDKPERDRTAAEREEAYRKKIAELDAIAAAQNDD